jgi:hypothetical protein
MSYRLSQVSPQALEDKNVTTERAPKHSTASTQTCLRARRVLSRRLVANRTILLP